MHSSLGNKTETPSQKKKKKGKRNVHAKRDVGTEKRKTAAESGVMHPQAKECQELLAPSEATTEEWSTFFPGNPEGTNHVDTSISDFWPSEI